MEENYFYNSESNLDFELSDVELEPFEAHLNEELSSPFFIISEIRNTFLLVYQSFLRILIILIILEFII